MSRVGFQLDPILCQRKKSVQNTDASIMALAMSQDSSDLGLPMLLQTSMEPLEMTVAPHGNKIITMHEGSDPSGRVKIQAWVASPLDETQLLHNTSYFPFPVGTRVAGSIHGLQKSGHLPRPILILQFLWEFHMDFSRGLAAKVRSANVNEGHTRWLILGS